ncbi:unnamed protein product [Alternaria alternata]
MAGRKRAASPSGGASAAKKTKKKKKLLEAEKLQRDHTSKSSMNSPNLSLVYVSRQLHYETSLLPYMLTTFYFHGHGYFQPTFRDLKTFLQRRSKIQIKALSKLVAHRYGYTMKLTEKSGNGRYWMNYLGYSRPSEWYLIKKQRLKW